MSKIKEGNAQKRTTVEAIEDRSLDLNGAPGTG